MRNPEYKTKFIPSEKYVDEAAIFIALTQTRDNFVNTISKIFFEFAPTPITLNRFIKQLGIAIHILDYDEWTTTNIRMFFRVIVHLFEVTKSPLVLFLYFINGYNSVQNMKKDMLNLIIENKIDDSKSYVDMFKKLNTEFEYTPKLTKWKLEDKKCIEASESYTGVTYDNYTCDRKLTFDKEAYLRIKYQNLLRNAIKYADIKFVNEILTYEFDYRNLNLLTIDKIPGDMALYLEDKMNSTPSKNLKGQIEIFFIESNYLY